MANKQVHLDMPLPRAARFTVVGVVASAGGLEAFKQLLKGVPVDCRMAFVLVPHLDPKYQSQMVALLSKVCSLPIVEATQGMAVEVNHVYVIPSGTFLTISNGLLQLSAPASPHGKEIAIDFFLRSLAKDQGEHSIGIVLSGTGSHGTLGVREIKLAGGMAIAQQPTTAEFEQMPSSIITAGLADFVLAPAEMPAALMSYIRQPYVNPPETDSLVDITDNKQLGTIFEALRQHAQYDFTSYRKNMLMRRIQRRMGLTQFNQLEDYVDHLKTHPKEVLALYRDLLISVTAFFRDPEAYDALKTSLLTELAKRDADQLPFRVWVPGCATGEEAYSLAMLMIECQDEIRERNRSRSVRESAELQVESAGKQFQIFASDVDEAAIAVARAGIYLAGIASDVSPERLERFFVRLGETNYQIGKQLRDSVVFSRQNLIQDAPFSKINLISCRNLLIYLEPEMQQKVISLFHFALAQHGCLMLGPSETISRADDLFAPVCKRWRVFQKVAASRRRSLSIPLISTNHHQRQDTIGKPSMQQRRGLKEFVDKAIIDQYAPATALINRRFEVLYVSGPLVDYLEFPPGEPNHDLLAMARPGLRTKLRIACQKAMLDNSVIDVAARVKRGGVHVDCTISIRNLKRQPDEEMLQLVSFFDKTQNPSAALQATQTSSPESESGPLVQQLERELRSNSEELKNVIEEFEGANEDLKTSNEEIMSMNEELQSANEELETSREELQSLNEELNTVNSELQDKVEELDTASNDILNLMASTEIATLFLDANLLIQRFTPPTVELLNLRATDIGRPLTDITTRFIDHSLANDCRRVIENSQPMQNEVEGKDERLYLRRILPYRDHDGQVDGVVITFVDLTERLLLEKSLKESEERLQAILNSASDAILSVDENGLIDVLNPATEDMFGYQREELRGRTLFMLLPGAELDNHSEQSLSVPSHSLNNGKPKYQELAALRKDGTSIDVEMAVSRNDQMPFYTASIRDVSQRKELQARILEIASDEQRRIGQELHDGTQQELTGLTLIAGTLQDLLSNLSADDLAPTELGLNGSVFAKLKTVAGRLVVGLTAANHHVQSLSHGIMPVQIDAQGLQSALAELAAATNVDSCVTCQFVQAGSLSVENNAIANQLYRIAQEAINNAQRHGLATEISVSLSVDNDQISLEVRDDGIGFDAANAKNRDVNNHGAGLQIMQYRANTIGGVLSISKGEFKGTVLRCLVPTHRNIR